MTRFRTTVADSGHHRRRARASTRGGAVRDIAAVVTAAVVIVGCVPKASERILDAESRSTTATSGVTDDAIKVGFIIVDQTRLGETLGFEPADAGDVPAEIEALVDDVNERGGIAGREVVPVIRVYDALTDSPANEEKLCRSFTEDEPVFAVVMNGMLQASARPCYAAAGVVMLDQTLFPIEATDAAELAPFLYQPSLPEYGAVLAGLAAALRTGNFFDDDSRLGIVGIDSEQNRRVTETQLLPRLAEMGVEPVETQWVDPTSSATLQAGQNQAVLAFKDQEVDRVIVIGGSRLLAFFVTIAIPQEFNPAYAVTTFDNPAFISARTPDVLRGSVGLSLLPAYDLTSDPEPFPLRPAEIECVDVLAEGGQRFADREVAREAMQYCDAVRLLEAGFDAAPSDDVTVDNFGEGVARLGRFDLASGYMADWSDGVASGASAFRTVRFDDECGCFETVGAVQELPR